MKRHFSRSAVLLVLALGWLPASQTSGQQVKLVERPPDPHGSPRPFRDARDVPVRTSLYLELAASSKDAEVKPETVTVTLQKEKGEPVVLLAPGQKFAEKASGWLRIKQEMFGGRALAVYVEPGKPLDPSSSYTVRVQAGPEEKEVKSWNFTTEASPSVQTVTYPIHLAEEPIRWHGRFFSGLCNVIFCSEDANYGSTYELMAQARKKHPRVWDYQRDFWPTGTEFRPAEFLPQ